MRTLADLEILSYNSWLNAMKHRVEGTSLSEGGVRADAFIKEFSKLKIRRKSLYRLIIKVKDFHFTSHSGLVAFLEALLTRYLAEISDNVCSARYEINTHHKSCTVTMTVEITDCLS